MSPMEVVSASVLLAVARITPSSSNSTAEVAIDLVVYLGILLMNWRPRVGAALVAVGYVAWIMMPSVFPTVMVLSASIVTYHWVKSSLARPWAVALVGILLSAGVSITRGGIDLLDGAIFVAVMLVAWIAGVVMRNQLHQVVTVREERAQALRRIRVALAGELHDTVAQSLALVVMNAEDALEQPGLTDPVREELLGIVEAAQHAVRDLRSTLDVLRRIEADFSEVTLLSVPPLADVIEDQTDALTTAGFEPEITSEIDDDALDRTLQQSLCRVTMELASNIRWHGQPGPCRITIRRVADAIEVEAFNQVRATPGRRSGGLGLVGVNDRVRLHQGTMSVDHPGPRSWRVRVSLPLEPDGV